MRIVTSEQIGGNYNAHEGEAFSRYCALMTSCPYSVAVYQWTGQAWRTLWIPPADQGFDRTFYRYTNGWAWMWIGSDGLGWVAIDTRDAILFPH